MLPSVAFVEVLGAGVERVKEAALLPLPLAGEGQGGALSAGADGAWILRVANSIEAIMRIAARTASLSIAPLDSSRAERAPTPTLPRKSGRGGAAERGQQSSRRVDAPKT